MNIKILSELTNQLLFNLISNENIIREFIDIYLSKVIHYYSKLIGIHILNIPIILIITKTSFSLYYSKSHQDH